MEIKIKAEKVIGALAVTCMLEMLLIGFFIAYNLQVASELREHRATVTYFMEKSELLAKQVDVLEKQTREIEREYTLYITGISRDLGPSKVLKSIDKTKKFNGIGGSHDVD